ncbi:hypothetical protein FHR75_001515 [Kineococcus radiotolerans]|uniref:Uncharacterized protein n=1 Tax=Kineococcus radiotolerans TaxID=131568 RepID=A0A7W4TKR8_KINRA|nr:hypothetical protein [Kineococcus radiotolerans]MBB2900727.1 hypothetical protein [Kineococcus radiotolerans]
MTRSSTRDPRGPAGPTDAEREAGRLRHRRLLLVVLALSAVPLGVQVLRVDDLVAGLLTVVVAAVVLVPLLVGAAALWARARVARVQRLAGPGAFAAFCGLSDDPAGTYLLVLTAGSLAIRDAEGKRTVLQCPWSDVRGAVVAPVVTGPWRRRGLRLELSSGARVDLAFPGRWVVTHPVALVERAAAEVRARRGR